MRSKANAETLNRLKYAGCPDLEGNLLRMTADFAFRVEYARQNLAQRTGCTSGTRTPAGVRR